LSKKITFHCSTKPKCAGKSVFSFFSYFQVKNSACPRTTVATECTALLPSISKQKRKNREWIIIIKRLLWRKNLQTCKDFCDGDRSMKIGPIIKPLISNHNAGEFCGILWKWTSSMIMLQKKDNQTKGLGYEQRSSSKFILFWYKLV
jgi:hypothetical protein